MAHDTVEEEYPIKVTVPMGLDGKKIEIKEDFELVDATKVRLDREKIEKELDEARHNRDFEYKPIKVRLNFNKKYN